MKACVKSDSFQVETRGFGDILDITASVSRVVTESAFDRGVCTVFVPGSTAGLTTIEYEPGVVEDLKKAVERQAHCVRTTDL